MKGETSCGPEPGPTGTSVPACEAPLRFVFCGVGGQGSLFASLLLGDAAVAAGFNVVMSEIHGMSQRGGSVLSTVILGPAHGPLVAEGDADVLVSFEPAEAIRAARFCSKKTVAVVAMRPVVPTSVSFGAAKYPPVEDMLAALRQVCGRVVDVDAAGIAERCGVPQAVNVVVLGALAATGILPFPHAHFADAFRLRLPLSAQEGTARVFEAGRTGTPCAAPPPRPALP
jgi:indolepyruvate ferredoxin oxidoreductase beta subunit